MGTEMAADGAQRWRQVGAAARTVQEDVRPPSPPLVPPVLPPPIGGFGTDRDAGRGTDVVTRPVPEGPRNEELVVDGPQAITVVEKLGDGEADRIEWDKQNRHVTGTKFYRPGEGSPWTHPDAQALLDAYTGRVRPVGSSRRGELGFREQFATGDVVIGRYRDRHGIEVDTTRGTIHYGKGGAHIVPAAPRLAGTPVDPKESARCPRPEATRNSSTTSDGTRAVPWISNCRCRCGRTRSPSTGTRRPSGSRRRWTGNWTRTSARTCPARKRCSTRTRSCRGWTGRRARPSTRRCRWCRRDDRSTRCRAASRSCA
ncbi:MAG: hypothetical protein INR65_00495 [Gluconacetobacter diazotrophicus]|nr:hypothetical protein [Gluconacetobacter diazotrophicus]